MFPFPPNQTNTTSFEITNLENLNVLRINIICQCDQLYKFQF